MNRTTHTRIYKETLRKLRHIHAETEKKMLDILEDLINIEWNKLQRLEEKQDDKRNLCDN